MQLSDEPAPKEPASKEDIETLGDKLVWPPPFTRDIRLKKMQQLLKKEEEVMRDPSLSDSEKVLRVAEIKQQYNVQDKEVFEPQRLGAVPAQPLPQAAKKMKSEDSDDAASDDSDTSVETVIDQSEYEDDLSDDDEIDQVGYSPESLLSLVAPYRKAKTSVMLKKLAVDGKLNWDGQGRVYYKGNKIPGSNIKDLVTYFQTAHKKSPLPQPPGKEIFGQALRKANALEDVLLGGREDDSVRSVFKGRTPKTPWSRSRKFPQQARKPREKMVSPGLSRPTKRRREEDTKTVTHLEY